MSVARTVARWWNSSAPAERLGILRAAIGGYALWYIWTRAGLMEDLAREDPGLFAPVGLFRLLGGPFDARVIDGLVLATILAGIAFVLGAMHRISGVLFAGLFFATMCYRNSWSMVYHSHNALVIHVLILGVVRAADGFSLDACWRSSRGGPTPRPGPEYAWPIRAICAVTVVGYFLAGLAKLCGPAGLGWALGKTLREQIAVDTIRKEILEGGGMPLAYALYDQVWLFTLIGIGTYVLELGAPFFLCFPRARRGWAIATWGMHWGILAIMGIKFRYQLCFGIFLPFFPVEKPWFWLRDRLGWSAEGSARERGTRVGQSVR